MTRVPPTGGTASPVSSLRSTPSAPPSPGPAAPRSDRPAIRRAGRPAPLARVVAWCALIAAALHCLAVAWTWLAWTPGVRGAWLVWLDLPVSLVYLHRVGPLLLPWSLLLGGLQWAGTGALLAWLVGRAAGRRAARRP